MRTLMATSLDDMIASLSARLQALSQQGEALPTPTLPASLPQPHLSDRAESLLTALYPA